jgi:hypothetical protein
MHLWTRERLQRYEFSEFFSSLLNVSGPSMFSFTNNTAVFGGASFPFGLPANLAGPAGLPAVGFAHGRIVVGFDAFGNIISISFTGIVRDVCKELE